VNITYAIRLYIYMLCVVVEAGGAPGGRFRVGRNCPGWTRSSPVGRPGQACGCDWSCGG
jgi:hypothetical protein